MNPESRLRTPKPSRRREWPKRAARLGFLILAILPMIAGLWGGLTRLPLNLPQPDHANWITFHGPLMVCGFLGTVIALERAVGLGALWTYAAPLLTGAGALTVAAGSLGRSGSILVTVGSLVFFGVTLRVIQIQKAIFTITMSLGGAAWFIGNLLWFYGWTFSQIVPWWFAFLALTILGERLDLSRFQKQERMARPLLAAALILFLSGVGLSAFNLKAGERVTGIGILALALWLGRFDIARRTVKERGLPRFMATCLLIGFVWLGISGILMIRFASAQAGGGYDAALHSFFLGFVFLMIFGHAPVIFPAILGLPLRYHPLFYGHVALLNFSLLLRLGGDLANAAPARQWGGILNAASIFWFLLATVSALVAAKRSRRSG